MLPGLTVGVVMLAIMTGSCSLKPDAKLNEQVGVVEREVVIDDDKTVFLKEFYLDYVLYGRNKCFEEIADEVCTSRLLKVLADNYGYDCDEGNCYAIWLFRTGLQDGLSDENKVISVIALEDNWYQVEYVDMGIFGTTSIHFVEDDGALKMDEIKQ